MRKAILLLGVIIGTVLSCSNADGSGGDPVDGCTDPAAMNYDPAATQDDGSCEYNPSEVPGCTDSAAVNYDPQATLDDGSCEYGSSPPDWNINESEFEYNGSVIIRVESVDGSVFGIETDRLAAFVNGELRGVTEVLYFPPDDVYLFFISVFSNEGSGEEINFKYWHSAENKVYPLVETLGFTANMIIGTPDAPLILHIPAGVETYFSFTQSVLQAFYFIAAAAVDGESLSSDDWVAVFNGSVCVGAARWEGPYTTVPAMGNDGAGFTEGYLTTGDVPRFLIYDASSDRYLDAIPSGVSPSLEWNNLAIINIDLLSAQSVSGNR